MMHNDPLQDLWSHCDMLTTFIPASVIAWTLCYDILCSVRFPAFVQGLYRRLTSPFRNFLHLEDLEETPILSAPTLKQPRWKGGALISLSFFQTFIYLVCISADAYQEDCYLNDLVSCVAWAYATFRLCQRSPSTPPYLLLLFCALSLASSVVNALSLASSKALFSVHFASSVVEITVSLSLIRILGTLPVKSYLPGPCVAAGKEVRFRL